MSLSSSFDGQHWKQSLRSAGNQEEIGTSTSRTAILSNGFLKALFALVDCSRRIGHRRRKLVVSRPLPRIPDIVPSRPRQSPTTPSSELGHLRRGPGLRAE